MRKCRLLSSFLFLTCFSANAYATQENCPKTGKKPGDDSYSQLAVDLCFQDMKNLKRHLEVASADGSIVLVVDGETGGFYANGRALGGKIAIMRDQEVLWSPDSRAVIFTSSLGAAGPVGAGIGLVVNFPGGVPDVVRTIRKDFAANHPKDPCRNDVNVGGLTWLEGSRKAVLAAEVPPSPQCEDTGGYFDIYVVSVPEGRIVARYTMKEAIKRWHSILGPRLKGDIELLKDR